MRSMDIVWRPYGDYLAKSNVRRLMERQGLATYEQLIHWSTSDVPRFWEVALEDLGIEWFRPYDQICDLRDGFPWARWFVGGTINIVHNCLDRHLTGDGAPREAIIWEGDDGSVRRWGYDDLGKETARLAGALRALGVRQGDVVGIYMPMVPEVVAALFACFKIGAVALPIVSGFGPNAVSYRLADANVKVLLTADARLWRGTAVAIKNQADLALVDAPSVKHVVVLRRLGIDVPMMKGRDHDWHELLESVPPLSETEHLDAEAPAMILYTSGTTGKAKGCVHTHAGSLAQIVKEVAYYMDLKSEESLFWLTDVGWMMAPWEIIGATALGASVLLFEGILNHPNPDRVWELVARHKLSHLGMAPTGIRLLRRSSDEWVERHDLSSLRVLGSTGEPWDPASYMWYFEKIGGRRCPIINLSGGTEIVGCHLAPLPICELKPCTLRGPGLGMDVDVFDELGKPMRGGIGHLVCKHPAPSMTKGFLNNRERYLETYFSRGPSVWYHGDWAFVDEDGFWFLHGRADDTIKVAGKRVGPGEIESVLNGHPGIAEAAAIGVPHEIKGEAIVCFVVLRPSSPAREELKTELKNRITDALGQWFRPREIRFVGALPKTRSAKIVRAAMRRKFLGEAPGDVSSIENPEALEAIYPETRSTRRHARRAPASDE
jgi:acetyl-CoA synthetase